MKNLFVVIILFLLTISAHAQSLTGVDQFGNMNEFDQSGQRFNPYNNDTTKKKKIIPKGLHVWTVDRKLGDIQKADADTLPHLYPQSTLGMGKHGEYNTTGTNYSARLSRIFIDRPETEQFIFTQLYDQVQKSPDQFHFTNTLSPITNLSYDNCGNKTDGEDHLDAKFAVNAGKRIGIGFDLNYAYARGYYQNQSLSHFNATLYGSYLGDKYQLHALFMKRHQKATENGGITNDNYIVHPEWYSESYASNELPVNLASNWNRNNSEHVFVTHRYNLGFYKKVKMTDEEIEARKFAESSASANSKDNKNKGKKDIAKPAGRPEGAKIVGKAPSQTPNTVVTDTVQADTARIKVVSKAVSDSLLAIQAKQDSLDALMKDVFVPVTSFIHTVDLEHYERIYQAYKSPADYYANTYYPKMEDNTYTGDSIFDTNRYLSVKNTLGIALLEGFNKWAKAGVKVFATHQLRQYQMPQLAANGFGCIGKWTENNISLGGRLSKTQGETLHYGITAETWTIGEDAGQLKVDFNTDLNFPLWNDTIRLAAKAYFHSLHPTFFERHYHSKHIWWDENLDKTTRTRLEGIFSYDKTDTKLRVAIEEIQNLTYFSMNYTMANEKRTKMSAAVKQCSSNINVLTAQLDQKLRLGPIHWDNILTYQASSNEDVLPLPTLNVFTNLYLGFTVSKVLRVELGGSATFFTRYYAPDFCSQLNQYAIQENADSRIELGEFPFIDIYANFHLKHARFFFMMSNAATSSFNKMSFLTPHYPVNSSVLHMGVSWNFFN